MGIVINIGYHTRSFSKESWLLIEAENEALFGLSVVTGVQLLLGNVGQHQSLELKGTTSCSLGPYRGKLLSPALWAPEAVASTVPLDSAFCLAFL